MRSLICNGSPSGRSSVSELMADALGFGFALGGGECIILHLAEPRDMARATDEFATVDAVVVVAPLFTDSMPALVKTFIEAIGEAPREGAPALGFVVHSRYGESVQARELARYYERLAARLDCHYLGTAVQGRSRRLAQLTPEAAHKLLEPLMRMGQQIAGGGVFGERELEDLARPERLSTRRAALLRLWYYVPISQWYWNSTLRANGAFYRRFVRPYR